MSSQIHGPALPYMAEGRHTADSSEDVPETMSPYQVTVHRCLCVLIVSLIFEGIARKAAPSFLGVFIFFFKDFVTCALLFMCIYGGQNAVTSRLLKLMGVWTFVLLPCIISTALRDPILALFGVKQYALFPTIAAAMSAAYLPGNRRHLFSLIRLIALSLIVTTLVAVAQNRLPAGNWLNLSVAGEDMSGFSAGGYLRVSSTFSFCGQYCFYLNALCFCLPAVFYYNQFSGGWAPKTRLIVLVGLFIAGTFLTGSRASVLGNVVILGVGGLLAIWFEGTKAILKVLVPVCLGISLLGLLQTIEPELFAAYEARMAAPEDLAEVETRIKSDFLDWMYGWVEAPPTGLGYGLGVMSNGSDKISPYAAGWRGGGLWTETDRATTFFEGGWYLMIIWYGFRLWIIIYTLMLLFKMQTSELRLMGAFAWGYILVIGVMGTLAIQPPLAIWWWLAVGLIICLGQFDGEPPVKETDP